MNESEALEWIVEERQKLTWKGASLDVHGNWNLLINNLTNRLVQ